MAKVGEAIVRIVFRKVDDAALEYLRGVGGVRVEDNTVFLSTASDAAEINAELIRRGYQISEFGAQKEGLEDYFLDLIGEAK